MKSILQYTSVKDFLSDRFYLEKTQGKNVTLANFSEQFDMSGSMFKMILEGTRKLSLEKCHDIARKFQLSFDEEEYFETLLLLESASENQYAYYQKRLQKIKKTSAVQKISTSLSFILSQWYLPALLIYLVDQLQIDSAQLSEDQYKEIEEKFKIPAKKIDHVIAEFQKAGFLKLKSGEKPHIVFSKLSTQVPQKSFLKSTLQETLLRIDKEFNSNTSVFQSHTFSIRKDNILNLQAEYKLLLEKYMAMYEQESNQDVNVVQAGFQIFPVK